MLICQSIWPAKISRSESRAQKPDISKINFQGVHVVEDVAINSEIQQRVFTSPNFANKSDRLTIDVGKKVLCKHGFPAKYDLAKFLLRSFTCCVLAFFLSKQMFTKELQLSMATTPRGANHLQTSNQRDCSVGKHPVPTPSSSGAFLSFFQRLKSNRRASSLAGPRSSDGFRFQGWWRLSVLTIGTFGTSFLNKEIQNRPSLRDV